MSLLLRSRAARACCRRSRTSRPPIPDHCGGLVGIPAKEARSRQLEAILSTMSNASPRKTSNPIGARLGTAAEHRRNRMTIMLSHCLLTGCVVPKSSRHAMSRIWSRYGVPVLMAVGDNPIFATCHILQYCQQSEQYIETARNRQSLGQLFAADIPIESPGTNVGQRHVSCKKRRVSKQSIVHAFFKR